MLTNSRQENSLQRVITYLPFQLAKFRARAEAEDIEKLKIAWRLCFCGNPSGNFVPECEPRKGVNWRLTVLDARQIREDSADHSDTYSLVLDLIVIPKRM
jgi:hypothetical protein